MASFDYLVIVDFQVATSTLVCCAVFASYFSRGADALHGCWHCHVLVECVTADAASVFMGSTC